MLDAVLHKIIILSNPVLQRIKFFVGYCPAQNYYLSDAWTELFFLSDAGLHRINFFVGHCPAENYYFCRTQSYTEFNFLLDAILYKVSPAENYFLLSDTVLHRIKFFCWTLSCIKVFFVGHCPAENYYCRTQSYTELNFCLTLNGLNAHWDDCY